MNSDLYWKRIPADEILLGDSLFLASVATHKPDRTTNSKIIVTNISIDKEILIYELNYVSNNGDAKRVYTSTELKEYYIWVDLSNQSPNDRLNKLLQLYKEIVKIRKTHL